MSKKMQFKKVEKAEIDHSHNLTSLVDCFAIILIYLLFATSLGELSLDVSKNIELPKASEGQSISSHVAVEIQGRTYLIDGQRVSMNQLAEKLKTKSETLKQNQASVEPKVHSLIIQADKNLKYTEINPVVTAGLQAGFKEVHFAVLKEN